MRDVRHGLALGAACQLVLLAVLETGPGLGTAGIAAGLAFGAAVVLLLARALRTSHLGPANAITLGRAVLVGGVVALVAAGSTDPAAIATLATPALLLDLVDGRVARRQDDVTALGARFDMEVDAALILALSVAAAPTFGWWVLGAGLARYAFGLATLVVPWLRAPTPPSRWRKLVAAVQGVTLTVAVSSVLPQAAAGLALAGALVLLAHSFAGQIAWLWDRRERRLRAPAPRRSAALSAAAFAVVWTALLVPSRSGQLDLVAFGRIPVEALVVIGLALIVPRRAHRTLAGVMGLLLALSVLLRALDAGFHNVLDRPFDPVSDLGSFGPAVGVLSDSLGHARAVVVVVATVALVVVAFVVLPWCVLRVTRVAARHRRAAGRTAGVLALAWAVCAGIGVQLGPGEPLAASSAAAPVYNHLRAAGSSFEDARTFAVQLRSRHDPQADVPANTVLSKLRGKDVLLVFVESYGQVAVQDSPIAAQDDAALRAGTAQLTAAGYGSRSAFLTSSTFGGISWLAHASLQSGLWIDSQSRYDELVGSDRYTLSRAFRRGGWRTVSDIPSDTGYWPEGRSFYRYDAQYNATNTGYRGPQFSYARIPDQYTLAALHARELARPHRTPVFAEVDLDSSHTPWTPLPSLVPWSQLGDGSVYRQQLSGQPNATELWRNHAQVQANYGRSIRYTMASLVSYVTNFHDPNLVVVLLGDHQPWNEVSGANPTHDVPISIASGDPAVLGAIDGWHWQPGLLPGRSAPVWRMDAFRNRFLDAYSGPPTTETNHVSRRPASATVTVVGTRP